MLVHGLGVTFTIWEDLTPWLSPHYKLIMIELPGNGASAACPADEDYYVCSSEALEDLRSELGLERWALLGYSLGAWVVRDYLRRWPQRAARAVFLCPLIPTPIWSSSLRLIVRLDRAWPALSTWLLRGWRLHGLVRLLGFNGANPPQPRRWTEEIASQPVESIKMALRHLPGASQTGFDLPEVPVRFIWGNRDTITRIPRPLRVIDRLVPGDHSAPMRAAPAVAQEIRQFLDAQ